MQDYEITEIKLAVAKEEGHANCGFGPAVEDVIVQPLVAGMHVISIPHPKGCFRLAVITDSLDLSLLGFGDLPLIVLHDADIAALEQDGCELLRENLERREILENWAFLPVRLDDPAALRSRLQEVFPASIPE